MSSHGVCDCVTCHGSCGVHDSECDMSYVCDSECDVLCAHVYVVCVLRTDPTWKNSRQPLRKKALPTKSELFMLVRP